MAKALCALEFAPGSYAARGTATTASFRVVRSGHAVVSGSLRIGRRALVRTGLGRLRRGRYTLVVVEGHEVVGLLSMRDIVRCWSGNLVSARAAVRA